MLPPVGIECWDRPTAAPSASPFRGAVNVAGAMNAPPPLVLRDLSVSFESAVPFRVHSIVESATGTPAMPRA